MTLRLSPRLVQFLKILAAIAVLGYLIHFVEWENLLASLREARHGLVVVAAVLVVANVGLEVWLWHRLSGLTSSRPSAGDSLSAVLCGHAAGIITPARSGEVVARAYYAGHADAWQAGTLALMHRLLDFHAILVLSTPACAYFIYLATPQPLIVWQALTVAGIAGAVLLSVLLARPVGLERLLGRFLRGEPWRKRVAFLSIWPTRERVVAVVLAFTRYTVYVAQYAFLLHAFDLEVAPSTSLLAGTVVFYVKLLVPPITYIDLGIRESVSVYVGMLLGIPSAAAFNAAFIIFLINLVLPSLLGAPLLSRSRRIPVPGSVEAAERAGRA